ncbi:uncharacterized protein IWZ02DRAFT_251403 [Phyllosticta citriasiana]|uniref:uncharacterized protein n=1 Tax=Phyllosticta citriasiana TaxID=595635 RepID=UPI0030FDAF9D
MVDKVVREWAGLDWVACPLSCTIHQLPLSSTFLSFLRETLTACKLSVCLCHSHSVSQSVSQSMDRPANQIISPHESTPTPRTDGRTDGYPARYPACSPAHCHAHHYPNRVLIHPPHMRHTGRPISISRSSHCSEEERMPRRHTCGAMMRAQVATSSSPHSLRHISVPHFALHFPHGASGMDGWMDELFLSRLGSRFSALLIGAVLRSGSRVACVVWLLRVGSMGSFCGLCCVRVNEMWRPCAAL